MLSGIYDFRNKRMNICSSLHVPDDVMQSVKFHLSTLKQVSHHFSIISNWA